MSFVRVCFNHEEISVNITEETTLISIFNMAKEQIKIDLNIDDYFFYYKSPLTIDNKTILAIIRNLYNDNRLFLIPKTDYNNLDYFLNNISPSLVAESAGFTKKAQEIIHHISTIERVVKNFSKEEIAVNVYSILPLEKVDDLEGDEKVRELSRWFKDEFFNYVKEIKCHNCGSTTNRLDKIGGVSLEESKCLASYAELFLCNNCGAITRFPRFNDVCKLLETRKGRYGEFANLFGAILYTLGYDVRLVDDMNDHLWVEFWSNEKNRYVSVDPCENVIDAPLSFEKVWSEKETWIFAVGEGQCTDVTRKYIHDTDSCISRRELLCPEDWYEKYVKFQNDTFLNFIEDDEKKNEIKNHIARDIEFVNKLAPPKIHFYH